MRAIATIVLVSVSLSLAHAQTDQDRDQLLPILGKSVAARLLKIDGETATFLDRNNRERPMSVEQIVHWGSLKNPEGGDQVLLVDRSLLIGRITSISRSEVVLETDTWGELTLARSQVAAVLWRLPANRLAQWQLRDRLISETPATDRLVLANGDQLNGTLMGTSTDAVKFTAAAGEIEFQNNMLATWRVGASQMRDATSRSMTIGLQDGTYLVCDNVRLDHRLHVELNCGLLLGSLAEIQPVDERLISYLRPASNVTFLSDLEPLGYKHIPFLSVTWDWKKDRSVTNGPLASPDGLFDKGIGMHSTARLAYQLEKSFTHFQAEACLDESVGADGSVVFRVFGTDDGSKWRELFKSDIVRGNSEPVSIDVDIRAIRGIALVVDFADRGDQLDRANWISARLVSKPE